MFTNIMAMQFELPNKILLPLLSLIKDAIKVCAFPNCLLVSTPLHIVMMLNVPKT